MIAMDYETGFAFPVPNVSAIIERRQGTRTQVLVQVRWKPAKDPVYSGTFEIPAGGINLYENVYDALKREVFEETGLQVTGFRPDIKMSSPNRDVSVFPNLKMSVRLGVGRRAGAEPQHSAAPERRPIERSSQPHRLCLPSGR
jgi:8-oxo-dGTP pyrophosphatase MutT (NUDIX family)